MKRRVVVTGIGILSCFGVGAQNAWQQLLAGRSGVTAIKDPAFQKISSRIYGKVPWVTQDNAAVSDGTTLFDPDKYVTKAEFREVGPAGAYAICAATEAINDADLLPQTDDDRERTGVVLGTGMCDMRYVEEASIECAQAQSYNRLSPYFIPRILLNTPAAQVSIRFGLHGVQHSSSTACALGAHAVGDAFRFIRNGDCDVIVAGGCEANLNPLAIAGFARMRALSSRFNQSPATASRPFDVQRDGFVIADGAACLILEELQHFRRRASKRARIYAELLGYGFSADAHHISAPPQDAYGARRSMRAALRDAGLTTQDVTHVNCHATSTQLGDLAEIQALCDLFLEPAKSTSESVSHVLINSTKGATGHLLGGAGAIECAFTALACRDARVAPSVNSVHIDPKIQHLLQHFNLQSKRKQLRIVAHDQPSEWTLPTGVRRVALKNSFGFGGTNASLCFASY